MAWPTAEEVARQPLERLRALAVLIDAAIAAQRAALQQGVSVVTDLDEDEGELLLVISVPEDGGLPRVSGREDEA